MPLILSRKRGETLVIDGPCRIRVLESSGRAVSLEIVADQTVNIVRGELIGLDPWAGAGGAPIKVDCQKWRYRKRRRRS